MKKYEIIRHTADLAIKGYGQNERDLYRNICMGFAKEVYIPKENVKAKKSPLKISGEDREALLVNLLNEIIYISDAKKIALTDIEIDKLSDTHLEAIAHYSPLFSKKIDVKGATYHGLKITRDTRLFFATVIFDI